MKLHPIQVHMEATVIAISIAVATAIAMAISMEAIGGYRQTTTQRVQAELSAS